MSCGCSTKRDSTTSERAMMCAACPERCGVTVCLVNGRTLRQNIIENTCPLGAFPDRGQVHWLGIRWWGVPAPIRWSSNTRIGRAILGGIPRPAAMPGCGCLVRLKTAWERISGSR
jgi:hypothetical protein